MDVHYDWGMAALGMLGIDRPRGLDCAAASFAALGRLSDNAVHLVLGLSFITLALMAVAGELGWEINHPNFTCSRSCPILPTWRRRRSGRMSI